MDRGRLCKVCRKWKLGSLYHAFKYFLVRWPGAPAGLWEENPRVLGLDVVQGGEEREVVFAAR